ncbi:hypothetical protein [Streptosporangium saharense]
MYLHAPCAARCGAVYIDDATGLCEQCSDEERRAAGPDLHGDEEEEW